MKKQVLLSVALAAVAISAVSGWVPANQVDEDKTISAGDVKDVLKDLKLEFTEEKDDEEKTMWTIKTKEGATVLLFQYGGKGDTGSSLSMSAAFAEEAEWEAINAWNRDKRFTKAYTIGDERVVLEGDLDVSVAPSKAVVKKFVDTFVKAVPSFAEAMAE